MAGDPELQWRQRWLRLAKRVYNWTLWGFVVVLQLTQVLGGVPSVQRSRALHAVYGRSPLDGLSEIPGTNDDPFTDRTIVCSLKGRLYKPQQFSVALATANSSLISPAASSVNGYRVLDRQGLVLSPNVYARYVADCNQVAATLDNIRKICTTLDYNVSAKHLRVVVDHKQGQDNDASLMALPTTLPLLILPYWDNAFFARYAMPGEDGSACVFRLGIKYENAVPSLSELRTVDRSVRETKTAE